MMMPLGRRRTRDSQHTCAPARPPLRPRPHAATAKQNARINRAPATPARAACSEGPAQHAHATSRGAALSPAREHLCTRTLECGAHERDRWDFLRGSHVHGCPARILRSEPRTSNPTMPSSGIGRCALNSLQFTRAEEASEHPTVCSSRAHNPRPLARWCSDALSEVLQVSAPTSRSSSAGAPGSTD